MHYDKQLGALVVPENEINRVCRDGAEIDFRNGWILHLPGQITIKAKGDTDEQDFEQGPSDRAAG